MAAIEPGDYASFITPETRLSDLRDSTIDAYKNSVPSQQPSSVLANDPSRPLDSVEERAITGGFEAASSKIKEDPAEFANTVLEAPEDVSEEQQELISAETSEALEGVKTETTDTAEQVADFAETLKEEGKLVTTDNDTYAFGYDTETNEVTGTIRDGVTKEDAYAAVQKGAEFVIESVAERNGVEVNSQGVSDFTSGALQVFFEVFAVQFVLDAVAGVMDDGGLEEKVAIRNALERLILEGK